MEKPAYKIKFAYIKKKREKRQGPVIKGLKDAAQTQTTIKFDSSDKSIDHSKMRFVTKFFLYEGLKRYRSGDENASKKTTKKISEAECEIEWPICMLDFTYK